MNLTLYRGIEVMDIVERLHAAANMPTGPGIYGIAANEIERLRAEVASLKDALIDCGHDLEKAQKANASLKGDNEQAYISLAIEGVRPNSLQEGIATTTQQLTATQEYAERLREALYLISHVEEGCGGGLSFNEALGSAVHQARAALALPKPWEKA